MIRAALTIAAAGWAATVLLVALVYFESWYR